MNPAATRIPSPPDVIQSFVEVGVPADEAARGTETSFAHAASRAILRACRFGWSDATSGDGCVRASMGSVLSAAGASRTTGPRV